MRGREERRKRGGRKEGNSNGGHEQRGERRNGGRGESKGKWGDMNDPEWCFKRS